jgi:predicted Rossmann fold nucleotide-binding protein DprA/Smf involved in DNA uptake
VLGCGLDVPYPRANTGLFTRVLAGGGTLASEHPPGAQPRAANFLPRNRLIAALSAAVVVVEAAEDSGSLSTARAGGSRGVGHVLVLPGAPWDPGAAGCNQLIRDGATLVRSLTDILDELGATVSDGAIAGAGSAAHGAGPGAPTWSGLDPPARAVLTALIDGQLLTHGRLAAATTLPPAALDAALLDLELAGLIRRTTAGIQAIGLPGPPAAGGGPAVPSAAPSAVSSAAPSDPRGPPPHAGPPGTGDRPAPPPDPRGPSSPFQLPSGQPPSARELEYSGPGGDDDRDD